MFGVLVFAIVLGFICKNWAVFILAVFMGLLLSSRFSGARENPGWVTVDHYIEGPVANGTIFTKIRGVTRGNPDGTNRQALVAKLDEGDHVLLVREEGKATAVKVETEDYQPLGYLSGKHSEYIAPLLDRGCPIGAVVKKVTGGMEGYYYGCNIRFTNIKMEIHDDGPDLGEDDGYRWHVKIIAKAPPPPPEPQEIPAQEQTEDPSIEPHPPLDITPIDDFPWDDPEQIEKLSKEAEICDE